MKILDKQINESKSQIKKGTIFLIALSILLVASILLFVLLSNYKIQLVMNLVGSIVNSLLAVIIVFICFSIILPSKSRLNFYNSLNLDDLNVVEINDYNIGSKQTVRKYIQCKKVIINGKFYFLLFDDTCLSTGSTVVVCGNYILGSKNEK